LSTLVPELRPRGVHVWIRSLAADPARYAAVLVPGERARAARLRFARDARRFIVARGQLRTILGAYAGCQPRAVRLVYGDAGKPSPAPGCGPSGLRFNVSHSGDVLVIAVARMEVGVDVEAIDAELDWRELAGLVLAPAEAAELEARPPADRTGDCLQVWTRKEAYVKALGDGLAVPLPMVTWCGDWIGPLPGAARGRWSLCDLDMGRAGYVGALVTERPCTHLHYFRSGAASLELHSDAMYQPLALAALTLG
jgi:4'-phosphopantetheinyl transferase